jgi:hypothetical protein
MKQIPLYLMLGLTTLSTQSCANDQTTDLTSIVRENSQEGNSLISQVTDVGIKRGLENYDDVLNEDHCRYNDLVFSLVATDGRNKEGEGTVDYAIVVRNEGDQPIETALEFKITSCGVSKGDDNAWHAACMYPQGDINSDIELNPGETVVLKPHNGNQIGHPYEDNRQYVLIPHAKLKTVGDFEVPYEDQTDFGTLIPHNTTLD